MITNPVETRTPMEVAVQERAWIRAAKAGEAKRISLLAELVDINNYAIDEPVDAKIARRFINILSLKAERKTADSYLVDIVLGHHNDLQALGAGLVAIVHSTVKIDADIVYAGANEDQIDPTAPRFKPYSGDYYTMYLDYGGFKDHGAHNGIKFTDTTEAAATGLIAKPEHVINIMGSGGIYWQNPDMGFNLV